MKRNDALLVYGTLKREGRLHGLLHGANFLGVARTRGRHYRMYDLGPFPAVLQLEHKLGDMPEGTHIYGEVYEVLPDLWPALDAVEGAYERTPVAVEFPDEERRTAWMYLMRHDRVTGTPVERGCWDGYGVQRGLLEPSDSLWYDANERAEEADDR